MQQIQGADAPSQDTLVLTSDGSSYEITGTSQISLIRITGVSNDIQNGTVVRLVFTSSLTVVNGATPTTNEKTIRLAGGVNFSATANDILTLMLCEVGGVREWREVSRSVN